MGGTRRFGASAFPRCCGHRAAHQQTKTVRVIVVKLPFDGQASPFVESNGRLIVGSYLQPHARQAFVPSGLNGQLPGLAAKASTLQAGVHGEGHHPLFHVLKGRRPEQAAKPIWSEVGKGFPLTVFQQHEVPVPRWDR